MIRGWMWLPVALPTEKAVEFPIFDNAEITEADLGPNGVQVSFRFDVGIDVSGGERKRVEPKGLKTVHLLFDEDVDRCPEGTRLIGLIRPPIRGPRYAVRLVTDQKGEDR